MKKLFCLMLVVAMLMSSVCAFADAPKITNVQRIFSHWGENGVFDHTVWKPVGSFTLNTSANIAAQILLNGQSFNVPQINGVSADGIAVNPGNIVMDWNAVNTNGWHPDEGVKGEFDVNISAWNNDGADSATYKFWYTFSHSFDDPSHITDASGGAGAANIIQPNWKDNTKIFSHNTVCSFGPHFRDISPELTDKWYMFTPIDLSQNGKQVYEMVGGNAYVIGTVSVTVNGDEVVVDYHYLPDVYAYEEFYTFFPDYESVTTVNPEEIETSYEYGQKLSIANDFGGDTEMLLFTCNTATFKSNNDYIVRFYENVPWRAELRNYMLGMIGMYSEEAK